jgi:hypothetical protein
LRGFAAWLGSPIGPGIDSGRASLSGAAVYREGVLSVDDAKVSLDGNEATGALTIIAGATPDITGTLAFPSLDMTPYFTGPGNGASRRNRLAPGQARCRLAQRRQRRRSPFRWPMQIGACGSETAPSPLRSANARLEIGLAEAAFSGGALSGMLAMAELPDGAGTQLEAQLRASDVDLAQAVPALGASRRRRRLASAGTDLRGSGADFGALVNTLSGTSSLDVRNGALPLFGMAELAGNIIGLERRKAR